MQHEVKESGSWWWLGNKCDIYPDWAQAKHKGEVDLNPPDFFLRPPRAGLRGYTYLLLQGPSRFRRRSGAFSVRVVKYWNRLPPHLILSSSVSIFKKPLDRQWSGIFPAAPVLFLSQFIDTFLYTVTPSYLCFPIPPIPDQLMWLFLALVAVPTINQWSKLC